MVTESEVSDIWPRLSTIARRIPNKMSPIIGEVLPGEYFFFNEDQRLWWKNPYTLKLEPLTSDSNSNGTSVCKLQDLNLNPPAPKELFNVKVKTLAGYNTDEIFDNQYVGTLVTGENYWENDNNGYEGWTSYLECNKDLIVPFDPQLPSPNPNFNSTKIDNLVEKFSIKLDIRKNAPDTPVSTIALYFRTNLPTAKLTFNNFEEWKTFGQQGAKIVVITYDNSIEGGEFLICTNPFDENIAWNSILPSNGNAFTGEFYLNMGYNDVEIVPVNENNVPPDQYFTALSVENNENNVNYFANYAQLVNLYFHTPFNGILVGDLDTTCVTIPFKSGSDIIAVEGFDQEAVIAGLEDCTIYRMLADTEIRGKVALMGDLVQFYNDKADFTITTVPTNEKDYGKTILERGRNPQDLLLINSFTTAYQRAIWEENGDPPRYAVTDSVLVHRVLVTLNYNMWNGTHQNDNSNDGNIPDDPNRFSNGDIVHWRFAKTHPGREYFEPGYNFAMSENVKVHQNRLPWADSMLLDGAESLLPPNPRASSTVRATPPNYYAYSLEENNYPSNNYPTEWREGTALMTGSDGDGFRVSGRLYFNMYIDPMLFEFQHMQLEVWVTDPDGNIKSKRQTYEFSVLPDKTSVDKSSEDNALGKCNYGSDAFVINTMNQYNSLGTFNALTGLRINNVELLKNNKGNNYGNFYAPEVISYFFKCHTGNDGKFAIIENKIARAIEVELDFDKDLNLLDLENQNYSALRGDNFGWASEYHKNGNHDPYFRGLKNLPNNIVCTTDQFNFNYHVDGISINSSALFEEKEYTNSAASLICKESEYIYYNRWTEAINKSPDIVGKYFINPNGSEFSRLAKSLFDKDRITNPRMRTFNIKLDPASGVPEPSYN
jgi:hypothetical protein